MRKSKLSLCVLLSTSFASAQIATSAQVAGGQVMAGTSISAPIVPGTDVWPGLSRVAGISGNSASLLLTHEPGNVDIDLQWQLTCQATTSGTSASRGEVLYELTSPILQSGELIIEWLPASTGTGQADVSIDVYDDGFIDAQTNATIPVVFGVGQYPLKIRVSAEATAQAGTIQGPWGSSWSWFGTASGHLRIRFVATHATATTAQTQLCAPAPALASLPNFYEGVQLEGLCAPTDHFAVFALGFQSTNVALPLSSSCRLLVAPVISLVHPLQAGAPVRQAVAVPAAVRPAQFMAQLVALNATTMTLSGSDLIRTNIQ